MKILIGCPTAYNYDYPLEHWLWWVYKQNTHKDFTALLCVNGEYPDGYIEHLQQQNEKLMVIDSESHDKSLYARLTKARQMIVDYAKKWDYDAILWLDMDTIPVVRDVIETLSSHNKPLMSGWYAHKSDQSQIVATRWVDERNNRARGMILKELKDHVEKRRANKPIQLSGVGFGCVLMNKSLFDIPFRYTETENYVQGEDIAFCQDALKNKRVRPYMDVRVVCKHLEKPVVGVTNE